MKLYCITSNGNEVFEKWSNDPCMWTTSDAKADTLDNHPEILDRLPKRLSETSFCCGLFLSEAAAWKAYFDHIRDGFEKSTGKKLTKETYFSERKEYAKTCMSIDIPEVRDVELEEFENKSCANCALDNYTEDDGYEYHRCPICSAAHGRPDQRCKYWKKCGN